MILTLPIHSSETLFSRIMSRLILSKTGRRPTEYTDGDCQNCGGNTDPDDKHCKHCGHKINRDSRCDNCKKELEDDWLYCPNCGKMI